jgi:hypothetical protein
MTRTLTIQYGDELLLGLGLSPSEFTTEARFLLAAKLCGRERVDFLLELPRVHVPVSNLCADDAEEEIAFARHG